MIKRPNPIRHMITWGIVCGTLFTGLFLAYLSNSGSGETAVDLVTYFANGLSALGYGSVIGGIVGFVGGVMLQRRLGDHPMPFTEADMNAEKQSIYTNMLIMPFVLSVLVFLIYANFLAVLIPAVIHGIISVLGAHHYMIRLQKWSKQFDQRKSKAKNEAFDMSQLLDKEDEAAIIAHDAEASEQNMMES